MAEFRKREDITQEIALLQSWSEMGAPRMGDLDQSLQSLVKTVDPAMLPDAPEAWRPPVLPPGQPPLPPSPFEDLPPGDDEERPRGNLLPWAIALLVGSAGLLYLVARWEPSTHANRPTVPGLGQRPGKGARPKPEPTLLPTSEPTLLPTATPQHGAAPLAGSPTTHPSVTARPHASPTSPQKQGARHALLGLQPHAVQPRVREYRVRAGDSLSGIARDQLGSLERWHEVYAANQSEIADPNVIEPGQLLTLPAAAAPTYRVRPGDTLKTIAAARLGDAGQWQAIYELNRGKLPSPTVLTPGTLLQLPGAATGGAVPAAGPGLKGAIAQHHTVRHGDSLSLIAQRYLGSAQRWPEIYYLNSHRIANPHWIYPGQTLAIPAARSRGGLRYVVRSGDSLWAIAAREEGSPLRWTHLYKENHPPVKDPHWIYPGQVLRLP